MATTATPASLTTAAWLAARLNITKYRAYDLLRTGRVPGMVRLGRQIRVDPEAVEEWIRSGGTASDTGEA